jgi:hypothetical protein
MNPAMKAGNKVTGNLHFLGIDGGAMMPAGFQVDWPQAPTVHFKAGVGRYFQG